MLDQLRAKSAEVLHQQTVKKGQDEFGVDRSFAARMPWWYPSRLISKSPRRQGYRSCPGLWTDGRAPTSSLSLRCPRLRRRPRQLSCNVNPRRQTQTKTLRRLRCCEKSSRVSRWRTSNLFACCGRKETRWRLTMTPPRRPPLTNGLPHLRC